MQITKRVNGSFSVAFSIYAGICVFSLLLGACSAKQQVYQQARTIALLTYPGDMKPIAQQELLEIPGDVVLGSAQEKFEFPAPPVSTSAQAANNQSDEYLGLPEKPILLQAGNAQWFLQVEGSASIIREYLKRAVLAATLKIKGRSDAVDILIIRDTDQSYQLMLTRQGAKTQIFVNNSANEPAQAIASQQLLQRLVDHWPSTAK